MSSRERLRATLSRFNEYAFETVEAQRARQLSALRECVAHHYARNPTWRAMCEARGARPEQLRSLDDLRRFPVVERDFLSKHSMRHGEGGALSVPMSELTTFFNSSGSTGAPKRIPIAEVELQSIAETSAMGLWITGLRGHGADGGGTLMPIFPHGPWPGAHFVQNGCEIIGFSPRATMGMPFEWHRRTIEELAVKSVVTTPSFLSALERELRAHRDPASLGLDRIVLGGEYFGEGFRSEMQRRFQCKVLDIYGCGETQVVLVESDELRERRPGWMHHLSHMSIIEIVEPGTETPVARGATGEMIITVLNRRAWPVVRYRVGDLLAADPEPERDRESSCKFPRFTRIQGRADDMMKYGNVMLFPATFFQALAHVDRAHDGVSVSLDKFRFEVFEDQDANSRAKLTVELAEGKVDGCSNAAIARARDEILRALTAQSDELHHAIHVGRQVPPPEVVLVDARALYQQEQKLRRMVDHRQSTRAR